MSIVTPQFTREPVHPTPRKSMSAKQKLALYTDQHGRCRSCHHRFLLSEMEVDHIIALDFGSVHELSNMQCLCGDCHKAKTSGQDIPAIAKAARLRAREDGTRRERKAIVSRGFSTDLKRLFSGRVVER